MELIVSPDVWLRFPGMVIVAVAVRGVDNCRPNRVIEAALGRAWADLPRLLAGCSNPQAHPRIGAWREAFRALGVSGKQFPSSVEALARRALRGGEPLRINPLVDLSAAVSLTHLVPTGGFDMGGTSAPLEVRLTRLGERFQALDEDTPNQVEPGEVAYAAGSVLLTRHLCWRQARTHLMQPGTRDAFLVSEVLPAAGEAVGRAVLADFVAGARALGGAEGIILSQGQTAAAL
jgi:DNA/RNA-binding domain of Phe-tRNA-synthetase-like protein